MDRNDEHWPWYVQLLIVLLIALFFGLALLNLAGCVEKRPLRYGTRVEYEWSVCGNVRERIVREYESENAFAAANEAAEMKGGK